MKLIENLGLPMNQLDIIKTRHKDKLEREFDLAKQEEGKA